MVRHEASIGCHCGSPLEPKSAIGVEKRRVFDLSERPLVVTENQASIYRCAHCRGETKAASPDGRSRGVGPVFTFDRRGLRHRSSSLGIVRDVVCDRP
jgi:hypothetical protein